MSFLAAIPVFGEFLDKIFGGIDRISTTDEERLKIKSEITQQVVPVYMAFVQMQQGIAEADSKLALAEAKSEKWWVSARRPAIAALSMINFVVILWWWLLQAPEQVFSVNMIVPPVVDYAFKIALAVNGLDQGTRGLEKIVTAFKGKEKI